MHYTSKLSFFIPRVFTVLTALAYVHSHTRTLTCLNALIQSESRRRFLVPQLLVDLRCEAFRHPVVVLAELRVVRAGRKLALRRHRTSAGEGKRKCSTHQISGDKK